VKYILTVICIALAFVIQAKMSVFGVSPDLTAVIAYYFGLRGGATKGILGGSLVGIIEDSVEGIVLGPNLLGKGMVGFFSSFVSGSLFRWTPLLGMISLFVLTVMDGAIVVSSRSIFELAPSSMSRLALVLLGQGIINVFLGILIRPRNVD
jgi:cell shape-determining protein MreD